MRLFIAVEIEDQGVLSKIISLKNQLITCSKGGRGIKAVEDENIHLTIRFLGEVSEALIPSIKACLDRCSEINSFTMKIKGIGAFPSFSRPRVIWVGVDQGVNELKNIRKILDRCLNTIVRPEPQEFVPHITIARIKSRNYDVRCLSNFIETYRDYEIGETPVTMVKLKQSILRPQGPIYKDVATVRLRVTK